MAGLEPARANYSPTDFKSVASTIPPHRRCGVHSKLLPRPAKMVLHCTEGSLAGALAEFQRTDSRKVSAHYVIDRNGDIYQMLNDTDCANHCGRQLWFHRHRTRRQ